MQKGDDFIGITVVFICHDGKGNYLMDKRIKNCRDEHGRWEFGGGALEVGDSVEAALRKELKEEYCVEPIEYKFLDYVDIFRNQDGVDTHWLCLAHLVLIDPDKVCNGEPHKFEELKWCRLDNLPEPQHSGVVMVLNKLKHLLPV